MSDWQPIETAPKDGTRILLAGGAPDCEDDKCIITAYWDVMDDYGWVITWSEIGGIYVTYDKPTHWMSLPEPPS